MFCKVFFSVKLQIDLDFPTHKFVMLLSNMKERLYINFNKAKDDLVFHVRKKIRSSESS